MINELLWIITLLEEVFFFIRIFRAFPFKSTIVCY